VKMISIMRGMLRAGGWGDRPTMGLDSLDYVALSEGGAGPQSLARSVSRAADNEVQGATHD
jgi:hypothetical protein